MILYRLSDIELFFLGVLFLAAFFLYECWKRRIFKRYCKITDIVLIAVSLFGILKFSVLGRTVSDRHVFSFLGNDPSSRGFWKEMELNVLLYVPFGASVIHWLDKTWLVGCVSFGISTGIEIWQYYYGTGTGQITDIICNTMGAIIGTAWFMCFRKYKGRKR